MEKELTSYESDVLLANVPAYAWRIIEVLECAGHEAWLVGGWVRDQLLGCTSHDADICTSAPWEAAADLLRAAGMAVHETGTSHGTITVVSNGEAVELTTYRVDGKYSDGRHPDSVQFVNNIEDDLARRDFTINAMAYHPERGLFDPFGGQADLEAGMLRCVGEARLRFEEDGLRLLRALRFAARFDLELDEDCARALKEQASRLKTIANERIGAELDGILASGKMGWALRSYPEVIFAAVPELAAIQNFDQKNPHHAYDVLEHTARVCDGVEAFSCGLATAELRWAALFHDCAKPACFSLDEAGVGHFYGHDEEGAALCARIMARMARPKELVRRSSTLVRFHMRWPIVRGNARARGLRKLVRKLDEQAPGSAYALAHELILLMQADILAKAAPYRDTARLEQIHGLLCELRYERSPESSSKLAVSGRDVMDILKLAQGKEVGEVLESLMSAVMEGELPNEREVLLAELERRASLT